MADNTNGSDKKSYNPVAVGLASAIAGAAVGISVAALSDKQNRQKVVKKMGELRDLSVKTVRDLKKSAESVKEELENETQEVKTEVDKKITEAEKELEEAKKQVSRQV